MTRSLCVSLAILVAAASADSALAQTLTPPPGATYGQPLPTPPMRPLYYSPFTNYDLLYGYSRGALTAPQPIGHEHIPTGPNGYIYRPVYAQPQPPAVPTNPVAAAQVPAATTSSKPWRLAPTDRPPTQASAPKTLPGPPPAPESVEAARTGPREF